MGLFAGNQPMAQVEKNSLLGLSIEANTGVIGERVMLGVPARRSHVVEHRVALNDGHQQVKLQEDEGRQKGHQQR